MRRARPAAVPDESSIIRHFHPGTRAPEGPPVIARRLLVPTSACALALAFLAAPAAAQKKAPDGAKVLLLSGGQRQHHGYREQALYLQGLLENTGRYEVTICEDAAILETPALAKYDILIVTADRRDPEFRFTESQQKAIFRHVHDGHGYVSIHGGDNAPNDWLPEWRDMLGGIYSHDTRGGKPDGRARKGTFPVRLVTPGHPILKGLADFTLKDELYTNIQMEPGVEPLAVAAFEGRDWPVAWTRTYGRGKVFHTPLGHRDFGPDRDDPLRDPNLSRLVLQGIDWVAAEIGKAPGKP
jgi:type 1 glutamine amidotransferase